jgi:hypothetical protein
VGLFSRKKVPTMPFQIDKQGNATLTADGTDWKARHAERENYHANRRS